MKTNKQFVCLVACLLLLSNCKKDKPQITADQKSLQTVSFNLSGFRAEINPLASAKNISRSPRLKSVATGNDLNINPSPDPQFVYFWSFNNSDLIPDIAADDGAEISFVASNTEPDFVGGYGLSPYAEAGQALNTKNPTNINVNLPLASVDALNLLAFDAGSSETGPKNFKISYSTDGGINFQVLAEENPLDGNSRTEFEYALDTITAIQNASSLDIKIEPVAGTSASGTFKLDNVRLTGVYSSENTGGGTDQGQTTAISKLHYFIFDTGADTLVTSGSNTFDPEAPQASLSVQLPQGTYSAIFVSNVSDQELLIPDSLHSATEFYVGNAFDNDQAEVFGVKLDDIIVSDQPIEKDATLKRFYSNISFHFTDEAGLLTTVKKISVSRTHDNFWYTPFGTLGTVPSSPVSTITLNNPLDTVNTLSFNQFIGEVSEAQTIGYTINAYDATNQLLRTFTVSSAIKNNVQLTFTGELFSSPNGGFTISLSLDWGDPVNETF